MPKLVDPALPGGALGRTAQPVLRAGPLELRPWQADDVAGVVAAYADPDIQRWHARSMTTLEARAYVTAWAARWAADSGAGWAVVDEGGLCGQISLRQIGLEDGLAEISYWVVPAARGRGVASRALGALTAWSFDELGLHRLEVNHSTANEASCRVALTAGYRLEGTKRSEALHVGGWHDMHLHARLAADRVDGEPG